MTHCFSNGIFITRMMIPVQGFGGPTQGLARLMAFIDGGYLRKNFKEQFGDEKINYDVLKYQLVSAFDANCDGKYRGDMLRVYYYDGIVHHSNDKYGDQDRYFENIRQTKGYQVRLGRLKPAEKEKETGLRQKGVDVQLAVDMVTKAHLNHYDFALLLAGDDDFLDVVTAVKDAGKRVFGFYFHDKYYSKDLVDSWDARIPISNFISVLRKKDN